MVTTTTMSIITTTIMTRSAIADAMVTTTTMSIITTSTAKSAIVIAMIITTPMRFSVALVPNRRVPLLRTSSVRSLRRLITASAAPFFVPRESFLARTVASGCILTTCRVRPMCAAALPRLRVGFA